MKLFFVLVAGISVSFACKCAEFDDKKSFCGADWVSHVKVTKKVSYGMTTTYNIQHINTYKSPSSLKSLPCVVYSAAQSATCGVEINQGEEYLLAGTYDIGKKQLRMATCGQFQPGNSAAITIEEKMRWKNIPEQLRKNLKTFKC